MLPVISYLILGGRCRRCKTRLPLRIIGVELLTSLLFALLWWQYDPGVQLALATIYTCIFLVLGVIDMEHGLLLNKIVYPSIILAIALVPLWPGLGFASAFVGAGVGFGAFLVPKLLIPSGMGWGDVKAVILVGLVTGFPGILVALFVSVVVAGAVAMALIALRLKKRKDLIPFGPFLSLGTLAALYWGEGMVDLYMSWLFPS